MILVHYSSLCEFLRSLCATYTASPPHYLRARSRSDQVVTPSASPLFALIIGINEYANIPGLKGAVSDAKEMRRYLKDVLYVPKSHIRMLLNRQATRDAIIDSFKKLRDDRHIKRGNPIIIFYAGHGSELPTPPGWGPQSKIQCLLPQDCHGDAAKDVANVIPDRTIGALIEGIAKAKGDNITVIFDCCHSGSGTRHGNYTSRSTKLSVKIPANFDAEIWGDRGGTIAMDYTHHGLQSHVLLAACSEDEPALEDSDGGHFTKALLRALRNCSIADLTYAELFDDIHVESQTPRCEGHNQRRILFDTRVPPGKQVCCYRVEADARGCVIHAGRAHGISVGAEFTLYTGRNLEPSAIISVDQTSMLDDFKTMVLTPMHLGNISHAKLTRVGKAFIYLTPGIHYSNLQEILDKISRPNFQFVENVEQANLEVALEDNLASFKISDSRANGLGIREIPRQATLGRMVHILDVAAHYFSYLDLANGNTDVGTNDDVTVNFYLLESKPDRFGLSQLVPVGPGYCQRDPSADNLNVIDFVVDPTKHYGIEIKNRTPRDLYLNAFLFNNSSLSVVRYYIQQTTGNPDVPLKKNGGTFTIGYGSGGEPPLRYSLEDDQDIDVSYLKIFFSSMPVNLGNVEQTSPFTGEHYSYKKQERKGYRDPEPCVSTVVNEIWFTTVIPVVQRRK